MAPTSRAAIATMEMNILAHHEKKLHFSSFWPPFLGQKEEKDSERLCFENKFFKGFFDRHTPYQANERFQLAL